MHSVEKLGIYSHPKIFREINSLVKTLISRKFCQRNVQEILSRQIFFREINYLVTSLVKTLLSRNFCPKSMRANFRNFQSVWQEQSVKKWNIYSPLWRKFRQINSFLISLAHKRYFHEILVKTEQSESIPQCGNYGNLFSRFFREYNVFSYKTAR